MTTFKIVNMIRPDVANVKFEEKRTVRRGY